MIYAYIYHVYNVLLAAVRQEHRYSFNIVSINIMLIPSNHCYWEYNECLNTQKTKFPYFLFWTCMSQIRNQEFRLYISLNW